MLLKPLQKVNTWLVANRKDAFTAVFIFLVGMGSFGLGRLSVIWPQKEPIMITTTDVAAPLGGDVPADTTTASAGRAIKDRATSALGKYVASKSGSYYHFPWCAGALRIKDANKVWFQTKTEAESRGLKPASNCPGL